ncbi:hypothetical protein SPRG_11870 [Saprolegnia parasitica CBS 223.65]|uniref:Cupin type-1 domain-containing protein n=1 Tax=Saprolegnia parasitica (strain CBS 223.65) TaxID=695850 RepID=A0A067BXL5_SAPPC|nr:hypothetical protein SPRG_11870 [Saprolegnia parasitica CBS 223.65]KDO23023.1 hypothetical protein SPRG_11870 [Saprolegnia parasitica CBS 223.65]|eukprot:XP_012206311.1 hypothetical protein SPRG_11870 [Saprolegnia parasitica CBS 223.65]
MLRNTSTCSEPLALGAKRGCPRVVFPLVTEAGFDMGLETVPSRSRVPLHFHDDKDEVIVVLRGTAIININGEEARATCGDLVFIRRGQSHEIRNEGDDELLFSWSFSQSRATFADSLTAKDLDLV